MEHVKMSASEARQQWSEVLGRVQHRGDRVVVEKHGKAIAVVVSPEELRVLDAIETHWESHLAAEAVKADDGVRVSHEQVLRELGILDAGPVGEQTAQRVASAVPRKRPARARRRR